MPIEIVEIAGAANARGKALGTKLKREIAACMKAWKQSLVAGSVADPDSYIAEMVRKTDFRTAIRQHTPDLLEELHGLAEGSGQPFDQLYIFQCMDEEWLFRMKFAARAAAPVEKCSTIAVRSTDGTIWAGQNVDMGDFADGHQCVFRMAPNGRDPGLLIFTIAGIIGFIGVNSFGVAVFVNSLPQLPSAEEGLPVAFVVRKLLQAKSAADAAQTVKSLPHATGQHYLVADASTTRSFEASCAGVHEYNSPNPSRILHTNHVLVEPKWNAAYGHDQTNTYARLKFLDSRLMTGNPDLGAIKASLMSTDDPEHPVCRLATAPNARRSIITGVINFTVGSMLVELRRGQRDIDAWISAGPPNIRGYDHAQLRKTT